jgi:chemotaxis-related protein WspB
MLALIFHIGADRHAVDSRHVGRVVPFVATRPMPGAPPWVVGKAQLLGLETPLIDVGALVTGVPCKKLLSSRVILFQYEWQEGERLISRPLGLIVERMTQAATLALPDPPDEKRPGDPLYLTAVIYDAMGPIRLIDPQKLLPHEARASIFNPATAQEQA